MFNVNDAIIACRLYLLFCLCIAINQIDFLILKGIFKKCLPPELTFYKIRCFI